MAAKRITVQSRQIKVANVTTSFAAAMQRVAASVIMHNPFKKERKFGFI